MNTTVNRVVIAEDDRTYQQLYKKAVEGTGNQVVAKCDNGTALLATCRSLKERDELPDLIISDLYMPGSTGPDAISSLSQEGFNVPVLIITTRPGEETLRRVLETPNCMQLLIKPVSQDQLIASIPWCIQRFDGIERAHQKLRERITLETAKDYLVATQMITGKEAIRRMRTQAMESGKTLEEIASHVITLSKLCGDSWTQK